MQLRLISELGKPGMQSSPELIRYSVMPLLRLQYNARVQESNLEETDQGLNLAVLTLEKFHVSLSLSFLIC